MSLFYLLDDRLGNLSYLTLWGFWRWLARLAFYICISSMDICVKGWTGLLAVWLEYRLGFGLTRNQHSLFDAAMLPLFSGIEKVKFESFMTWQFSVWKKDEGASLHFLPVGEESLYARGFRLTLITLLSNHCNSESGCVSYYLLTKLQI